jgi:hypothetical protein
VSDLSRLRARWIRLEKRIATLEASLLDVDDFEVAEIVEKIQVSRIKLELTITQTHEEEKRLVADANSKLRFTGV